VTLQRYVQLATAARQRLLQHQAYRRGTLQGNKIEGQQLLPGELLFLRQRGLPGNDRHEAVHRQRGKQQVVGGRWLEGNTHLHSPLAHHLDHLLINHVMHRDVHAGIAVAKGLQRLRQDVGGKRRHRGHRNFTPLQGKALTHGLLDVIPVGQQLTGHRQKEFPLLGKGHFAGAALQQRAAQRLL